MVKPKTHFVPYIALEMFKSHNVTLKQSRKFYSLQTMFVIVVVTIIHPDTFFASAIVNL